MKWESHIIPILGYLSIWELSRKNISPESLSVDYEQFKLPAKVKYLTYEEAVDIVRFAY